MKLLFDQNLSPRLVNRLADLFPNSPHAMELGLDRANDTEIWETAAQKDYVIVSKDEDYNDLSVLRGSPPKVIWIVTGNCKTSDIQALFRSRIAEIATFGSNANIGTLALG